MFYVYVLKSLKDDKLYIGQTNNFESRFIRNQKGYVKSTKNRRPLKLLFCDKFDSRSEAMKHEKFLKSGAGHKFIKSRCVDAARKTSQAP